MLAIARAVKLARTKSRHKCHKHAAIIFNKNQIIATGYNHEARHAEHDALSSAFVAQTKGASILVIRLRRDGRLGLSRPCEDCRELLQYAGLRWLHYTDAKGDIVKERV